MGLIRRLTEREIKQGAAACPLPGMGSVKIWAACTYLSTYTGLYVNSLSDLANEDFMLAVERATGERVIRISMPCGVKRRYDSPDELPSRSLACPCGDPNHWIVRYGDDLK